MQTLHVISHTHWDREWYETFQQFRLRLVHLVDKLLELLDEDPDFKHFMLDGQTIVLDDYLQMRPEMEGVLREHVQSGRILIGPWHILPDMFLVGPEAHVRNLLQGERTTRNFGPKMPIGYIPDPFGHPGQIPQILKGFDLEAVSLWRGVSADKPTEMWWEAPDGSRIFLAYLRDTYSNGANLPVSNSELFAEAIAKAGNSLAAHSAVDDHLIMLGTDHMEPSPFTSRAIACANENLDGVQVHHSTYPNYLNAIKGKIDELGENIPTICGELRASDHSHLLPGVLSTRMWIKQRNHASQVLLEKWAEPFSVFAAYMLGDGETVQKWAEKTEQEIASNRIKNVAPLIRQAWRLLMENHPHDSICGCSIDQVHDEMLPRFDQADQIGEELIGQSIQALTKSVKTQKEGVFSSVVLYNPFGFENTDIVEVEITLPEDVNAFELVDEKGNLIPHEFVGSSNEEFANVLLPQNALRDMIGAISEGWVAGSAIIRVNVTREEHIVTIDALLDEQGPPNIKSWKDAEAEITKYEADPTVTHFRVVAYSPMASKIRFASPAIPALGWKTLWLRAVNAPKAKADAEVNPLLRPLLPLALRVAQTPVGEKLLATLSAGDETKLPFVIENELYRVEVEREAGTLTVTDKATQTVYRGLNRFVDGGDAGDEYNYSPPQNDAFYTSKITSVKAFRNQRIPTLEISYELKVPAEIAQSRKNRSQKMVSLPIQSRVSLIPGVARVNIQTEIENLAKDHRLRVHFPAPFAVDAANYDGHFEVVQRDLGIPNADESWVEQPRPEVPQRAFTDVSNGTLGLMVANRGLPEVEVIRSENAQTEIALTLLRSVGWLSRDDMSTRQGHAGPGFETPGGQVLGKWTFDYAIIPHTGDWQQAYQQAYAFETSLRAIEAPLQEGELPSSGSFIAHSPSAFVISTVKEAEDGSGWLVRGYNITSDAIQLNLKPLRKFKKATQVNLAEKPLSALKIGEDGSVTVPVTGHQLVSILFAD